MTIKRRYVFKSTCKWATSNEISSELRDSGRGSSEVERYAFERNGCNFTRDVTIVPYPEKETVAY